MGFADIGAKKAMQPDQLFWIASQSKPITAAALMLLVDEGKVSLDDPVEKHLPEFKGTKRLVEKDANWVVLRSPAQPITVRQLLSHTSGMPFASRLEQPTLDRLALADRTLSYAMTSLEFELEQGTRYQ